MFSAMPNARKRAPASANPEKPDQPLRFVGGLRFRAWHGQQLGDTIDCCGFPLCVCPPQSLSPFACRGSYRIMRAQLVPLDGGSPVDVIKDLMLVGRKDECDLRLDHKSVSKMHCVIVKTDGLLLVRDLGSTNGTRVNGQRVRRAALLPNDQIAFASFKYKVFIGPDDKAAAHGNEFTQQLDAKELAALQAESAVGKNSAGEFELPEAAIQVNPLPDVYPEDGRGHTAK
jgi:hypothetical protein